MIKTKIYTILKRSKSFLMGKSSRSKLKSSDSNFLKEKFDLNAPCLIRFEMMNCRGLVKNDTIISCAEFNKFLQEMSDSYKTQSLYSSRDDELGKSDSKSYSSTCKSCGTQFKITEYCHDCSCDY